MIQIKQLFAFLLFLYASYLAAQNGRLGDKYFVLPHNKNNLSINQWLNDTIKTIDIYPFAFLQKITVSDGQQYLIIAHKNDSLSLYNFKNKAETTIKIPFELFINTIFIQYQQVFIGGQISNTKKNEEFLLVYHIQNKTWETLFIPSKIKKIGKGIDDFAISGDTLMAIDNMVTPKYILYYKLQPNSSPLYINYHEIASNYTNTQIHSARYNGQYLALNASYSSKISSGFFVPLIKATQIHEKLKSPKFNPFYWGYLPAKELMLQKNYLQLHCSFFYENDVSNKLQSQDITDFALLSDNIIFSHKTKGIAIFKIDSIASSFDNDIPLNNIQYTQPPNGEIHKISLSPNPKKIILSIYKESENYKHSILDLK